MRLAISYAWWVLLLMAVAVAVVAWASYAGAIVALPPRRRVVLASLRALTLGLLVLCLLRPVRVVPPDTNSDTVVPILVDVSRSMGLADVDGARRIDVASRLVRTQISPELARRFRPELWTFGDVLEQRADDVFSDAASRRGLPGALRGGRRRCR